jgi:hypothetical protein
MSEVTFGDNYRRWSSRVRTEIANNWRSGLFLPSFTRHDSTDRRNCYAYALGVTTPEPINEMNDQETAPTDVDVTRYYPGLISAAFNTHRIILDDEEIMCRVHSDLGFLGLVGTAADPSEDNGYLIKVYNETQPLGRSGFHFARRNRDGQWSHKLGYHLAPEIYEGATTEKVADKYHLVETLRLSKS